jgi:hypothetical protein
VESFDYREAGALCNDYGGQLAVLNTTGALNVAGLNKQVSGASEDTYSLSHSPSELGFEQDVPCATAAEGGVV